MDLANLERLCTDNPTSPLFARLADEYLTAGRKDEARHILEGGLEMYPTYVTGSLVYAKYLLAEKQFVEAQNFLLHVSAFSADYPGLRSLLERCQAGLHEPEATAPEPHDVSPGSHLTPEAPLGLEAVQSGISELTISDVFPNAEVAPLPVPAYAEPEPFVATVTPVVDVPPASPVLSAPEPPGAPEPIEEMVWPPPPPVDAMESMGGATFMERMESANATIPDPTPGPEQVFAEPQQVFNEPEQVFNTPERVFNEPEQVFAEPQQVDSFGLDSFGASPADSGDKSIVESPTIAEPDGVVISADVGADDWPPRPPALTEEPAESPAQMVANDGVVINSEIAADDWPPVPPAMAEDPMDIPSPLQLQVAGNDGVVVNAEIAADDWPPMPPADTLEVTPEPTPVAVAVSPVDDFAAATPDLAAAPSVSEEPVSEPTSQLTTEDVFGISSDAVEEFGAPEPDPVQESAPMVQNSFDEIPPAPVENSFDDFVAPAPATSPTPAPAPAGSISVQGGRIVSKTLAEIYTAQGVFEEAVLTYQLLKQQRPEENAIWNARIADLEKKIKERGPQ